MGHAAGTPKFRNIGYRYQLCTITGMAGLAIFDQNNSIAATTPIAAALKFCIRHKKMGS